MGMRSISVHTAITSGINTVLLPARIILNTGTILCVLLLFFHTSWWDLIIIPICISSASLYTAVATPRWLTWAYQNVNDIHQFQRSAELARLLPLQSLGKNVGIMSSGQKKKLRDLSVRFDESPIFIDDDTFPNHVKIRPSGLFNMSAGPLLTIGESGISVSTNPFIEWQYIQNERIIQTTYNKESARTGRREPAGSEYFFKFDHLEQAFEFPLPSLKISIWKLDLLLYTYRGRSYGSMNTSEIK